MTDVKALKKELDRIQQLHVASDKELISLMRQTIPDHLQIQRVKKHKLDLKDQIEALKNKMLPDIIA